MRDRDTAPHAGRPQGLARVQGFDDHLGIDAGRCRGTLGELFEKTPLVGNAKVEDHVLAGQEIADGHGYLRPILWPGLPAATLIMSSPRQSGARSR